jgi:hypothetical protein
LIGLSVTDGQAAEKQAPPKKSFRVHD